MNHPQIFDYDVFIALDKMLSVLKRKENFWILFEWFEETGYLTAL